MSPTGCTGLPGCRTFSRKAKKALIRARAHVDAWIEMFGGFNGFAWRTDPTAARLWHWLRCGEDLFEEGPEAARQARLSCLHHQLRYLESQADAEIAPRARWVSAVVQVAGALCFNDRAGLGLALDRLDAECTAQILPDGGHVSRAPSRLLFCLLQLQTLEELLTRAGIDPPDYFAKWIPRMGAMLAFFQTGDGALNPFNDGDESRPEVIEAALARLPAPPRRFTFAPKSGFQKLENRGCASCSIAAKHRACRSATRPMPARSGLSCQMAIPAS
jgi:uncharacterized heparinase superfamily protein